MQSLQMPYFEGMNYGMGVNTLTGEVPSKAVDEGAITAPTNAAGQVATYNLVQINSYEELCESTGISVDVSGQYGLFSGEGKFKYASETKFNTQSTFLLARCTVQNPFTQCESPKLKSEAADLIKSGKVDVFRQRYGDAFVRGMQNGGEYFAVISIVSTNHEDQESIAADMHAQYGGFLAGASVDAHFDTSKYTKSSKVNIQVATFQIGGIGEGINFTGDVAAVMQRLKDFPSIVAQNPRPYSVQVANYNILDLPDGPNLIDVQNQQEALKQYARLRLKWMTQLNDIEFVQEHPGYFDNPPSMTTLNSWYEYISGQLNEMTKQASHCANDINSCPLFSYTLPDGFAMPSRKANAIAEVPNLIGLDLKEAETQLANRGLAAQLATPVSFMHHYSVEQQSISAGTIVPVGSTIILALKDLGRIDEMLGRRI